MLIRCNIKKGTNDATDFENNYKANVTTINTIVWNGVAFIKDEVYADFKKRIDGNTITWGDVFLREDAHNYELWLEV